MTTTEWHNIVNNVTERGITANLITRETDGTITLKESGKRTATTLTRESILQGINDWADQTLLWQDDLDDDVAATWVPSARAVKAHHWAKATLRRRRNHWLCPDHRPELHLGPAPPPARSFLHQKRRGRLSQTPLSNIRAPAGEPAHAKGPSRTNTIRQGPLAWSNRSTDDRSQK